MSEPKTAAQYNIALTGSANLIPSAEVPTLGKPNPPATRTFTAEEVKPLVEALRWTLPQVGCFYGPEHPIYPALCIHCLEQHPEHKKGCPVRNANEALANWDAKLSAPGKEGR